MKIFRKFLHDCRALSAVEFALTAPVYAGVLMVIVDSHDVISNMFAMKQAVKTGEAYVLHGGIDVAKAKELVLDSWPGRNEASTVDVTKECSCAGVANSCTVTCTGGAPVPQMSIRIDATSPIMPPAYSLFQGDPYILNTEAVVRVR